MKNRPIGVFDSGVGGLTVLKEIVKVLAGEDIVYLGDTARIPYGSKSKEMVVDYFLDAIKFLLTKEVKAIVIACNTVSALAMEEAQKLFDIPIIGVIDPGVEAIVKASQNSKVGLIATEGTVNSQVYQENIKRRLSNSEVIGLACPLLVTIVEEGWSDSGKIHGIVDGYISRLKEENIDSLILGCTHYPVLRDIIKDILGDRVIMVDPAHETARATRDTLIELDMLSDKSDGGSYNFYVSDDPEGFKNIGERILGWEIKAIKKVHI